MQEWTIDLAYIFDRDSQKLYINVASNSPGSITIEYIPIFQDVSEITSDYWLDVLIRLAVAKTKIVAGRVRSRYTQSNAIWSQDGKDILVKYFQNSIENRKEEERHLKSIVYEIYNLIDRRGILFLYDNENDFIMGSNRTIKPEWLTNNDFYKDYKERQSVYSQQFNYQTNNALFNMLTSALAIMVYNESRENRKKRIIEYCKHYGFQNMLNQNLFNKVDSILYRNSNIFDISRDIDDNLRTNDEDASRVRDMVTHWMRKHRYRSLRNVVGEGKEITKVRQGIIAYEQNEPDYEICFEEGDLSPYAHIVNEETNPEDVDLSKIQKVNIFKTKSDESKILCMPTIEGAEKIQPREISSSQWQRLWVAQDKCEYKRHLAATLFADVLREKQQVKDQSQEVENENVQELSSILRQIKQLKSKHPDAVLLFRVGDFYQTYAEDAQKASKILGITLTRSNKTVDNKPLEMAGFPYHALDSYLPRLIRAGERVAICDQLTMPKREAVKESITPVSQQEQRESSHGYHR